MDLYLKKYPKVKEDNEKIIKDVIKTVIFRQKLDSTFYDHKLGGDQKDRRCCHLRGDWVLVYKIDKKNLILHLYRTGTHARIFRK